MPPKKKNKNKKKKKYLKKGVVDKTEMDNVGWTDFKKRLVGKAPVEAVKGIGNKRATQLRRKGIHTVGSYARYKERKK